MKLFVLLNTARKLGEYCSSDHPRFLQAVEQATEIFNGLSECAGELGFYSSDGSISGGGTRFEPDEPYLGDFAAALRTAGITVIRLTGGVDAAGLTRLVRMLAAGTDLEVGTGQIRQLVGGLAADGIRVDLAAAAGRPTAPPPASGSDIEEAVWKAEVRRLFDVAPAAGSIPQTNGGPPQQVLLAAIPPRRLAGLINEFLSPGSTGTVFEQFLVPYLRQAVDNGNGPEGLVPDHIRLQFIQLLRMLSPGLQVRLIAAVFETSHSFTRFAEDVLEAVPIHLAGKALAMISTEENTIHPRITSRFETLCRLTGWTASEDDDPPAAPGELEIDVNSVDGVVRCTPRFDTARKPEQEVGPAATAPPRPARRISFAAQFTPAGKRIALTRVGLDLLERSTTSEEARALTRTLPPLFTEALEEGDWTGLKRDWADLVMLVKLGRSSKPFLNKTLERIRKSFITTRTMEQIVKGIKNSTDESCAVFRQLLPALGAAAGESLVLALVASNNRTQRRNLLSVIVSYGQTAVPLALKRITDHRWYVVRNMISIIREVGDKRAAEELLTLSNHHQPQVRRELLNTFLALDHPAGLELVQKWIRSADMKLRSICIGLLGSHKVVEGRDILLQVLKDQECGGVPYSQPQKVSAVWALGRIGDHTVLPELQKFLRKNRVFKTPTSHELKMAILRSLPEYPLMDVKPLVRWGVSHGDNDEAATCSKLLGEILLLSEAGK